LKKVVSLWLPSSQRRTLEAERQADFSILDEIRDAFNDVPADEIEREVAKAVAAVRAEARQKRKDQ
jgi:hypothetical protein